MVVSFADILLVVIAIFGVLGLFRGVRAGALTTGAIFFAFVVVVFAGDLVIGVFRRLGAAICGPGSHWPWCCWCFSWPSSSWARSMAASAGAVVRDQGLAVTNHQAPSTWRNGHALRGRASTGGRRAARPQGAIALL